jgi:glutathione S-transferase
MAEWIDVEKGRDLPGLRLVLTAVLPGPWGEAAKGVFRAKGIPFARVRQEAGAPNDALFAWTGHRNAPIAIYASEPPRTGWSEILFLAERLGAQRPSLIPSDPAQRAWMFGLSHELMGEDGFGWSRRLMLFRNAFGNGDELPAPMRAVLGRMLEQYRYSRAAADAAVPRVVSLLRLLSEQLRKQRDKGHEYLMGPQLTALDIYWAAMAALVAPLPHELCPMPPALRPSYTVTEGPLFDALDPELLAHRDRVYERHLELPIEL